MISTDISPDKVENQGDEYYPAALVRSTHIPQLYQTRHLLNAAKHYYAKCTPK